MRADRRSRLLLLLGLFSFALGVTVPDLGLAASSAADTSGSWTLTSSLTWLVNFISCSPQHLHIPSASFIIKNAGLNALRPPQK